MPCIANAADGSMLTILAFAFELETSVRYSSPVPNYTTLNRYNNMKTYRQLDIHAHTHKNKIIKIHA